MLLSADAFVPPCETDMNLVLSIVEQWWVFMGSIHRDISEIGLNIRLADIMHIYGGTHIMSCVLETA